MAEEKTVWMTDGYGAKALVAKGDVDAWKPHGWSESGEPVDGERVWMRHGDHDGQAEFQAAVVEQWRVLGWEPSAPPEPVDLLHDRQLVDPQVLDQAKTETKSAKAAARGTEKE